MKKLKFTPVGVLIVIVAVLTVLVIAFIQELGSQRREIEELKNRKAETIVIEVSKEPKVAELVDVKPVKEKYFYNIPDEFKNEGGELLRETQKYIYDLSKSKELEYSIIIAQIEVESGYKSSASGDNGNSKGYMQIYQKYHTERLEKLGVTDLLDPIQNVTVGIDYLDELYKKYENYPQALMAYNMGENGARRLWDKGIFETDYTKRILNRAQEIKQDLQD